MPLRNLPSKYLMGMVVCVKGAKEHGHDHGYGTITETDVFYPGDNNSPSNVEVTWHVGGVDWVPVSWLEQAPVIDLLSSLGAEASEWDGDMWYDHGR